MTKPVVAYENFPEHAQNLSHKKLLELAAKSVGMNDYHYVPAWNAMAKYVDNDPKKGFIWGTYWNPLVDMKDAMYLASNLGLVVDFSRPSAGFPYTPQVSWHDDFLSNEEKAARSIVLAAAIHQLKKESKITS